jgi:hypothetical protein
MGENIRRTIKVRISMRRAVCERNLEFEELDHTGQRRLTKNYDKLGDRIECIFPMLNTEMT